MENEIVFFETQDKENNLHFLQIANLDNLVR